MLTRFDLCVTYHSLVKLVETHVRSSLHSDMHLASTYNLISNLEADLSSSHQIRPFRIHFRTDTNSYNLHATPIKIYKNRIPSILIYLILLSQKQNACLHIYAEWGLVDEGAYLSTSLHSCAWQNKPEVLKPAEPAPAVISYYGSNECCDTWLWADYHGYFLEDSKATDSESSSFVCGQ